MIRIFGVAITVLVALSACGGEANFDNDMTVPVPTREGSIEEYELLAWPGRTDDADGVRAFPIHLTDIPLGADVNVSFERPVSVRGVVTGVNPTPSPRARLPGTVGAIDADVFFRGLETLDTQVAQTDTEGVYTAWVTPGTHEVLVRPEHPLVPPMQFAVDVFDDLNLDLDLDTFVPIWGQVTADGTPRRGLDVRLRFDDGTLGPPVRTNADGWYELRAQEGMVVTVECLGDGIDPMIGTTGTVGPQGLQIDFEYQSRPINTIAGRLLDNNGNPMSGIPFKVSSLSIDGYQGGVLATTGFTDTAGNFVTRVISGQYQIAFPMERGSGYTSADRIVRVESGNIVIDEIFLQPLRALVGSVNDTNGQPIPNTVINCTELQGTRRSWSATTDQLGQYEIDLPQSQVSCSVAPGDRADIAATRVQLNPQNLNRFDFELGDGKLITGVVDFEGVPEEHALIEIRDAQGLVWATALTDATGAYQVRIQPVSEPSP